MLAFLATTSVVTADDDPFRAVLGYSACSIRNAGMLDDGKSDLRMLAKILAARCEGAYREWMDAVPARAHDPRGNYEMSLSALKTERHQRLAKPARVPNSKLDPYPPGDL